MLDAESEIVTAVETTTAKVPDSDHLENLVSQDKQITGGGKRICGDKGFLGHSQLETTQVYTHISKRQLKDLID